MRLRGTLTDLVSNSIRRQGEDDHELSLDSMSSVKGGIVALGKFDALHIGHRELVVQAAKVGTPYLLSFVGMAEVLGWEPRAPIVAKCDRKRVLSSWAPYCGNVPPSEFEVEFSGVRHLTPRQFVEKLSKDLGVLGVVAGENYRFGYRASGDALELLKLCEEYGMRAHIINSVMDKNQNFTSVDYNGLNGGGQVSSTQVRVALAAGDVKYASELLGRRHRLISRVEGNEWVSSERAVSLPKSSLLNLSPKEGSYENCSVFFGDEEPLPCKVVIDARNVFIELDGLGPWVHQSSEDIWLLGIEFGDS